jgi:Spy/CpxP family protein refolding chaperone
MLARLSGLRLVATCAALAFSEADAVAADPGYAATARTRAEKIVATLALADAAQISRVRDLLAGQYQALHDLHARRDAALASAGTDESTRIRAETGKDLDRLHSAFLRALGDELAKDQIERIKDGMTYGVLPATLRVYHDMFPQLTPAQRERIRSWLEDAREEAMDAGTSREKHSVFGRYKGRINNFLSAAGYDLKQAERDLARRRQAQEAAPTPANSP